MSLPTSGITNRCVENLYVCGYFVLVLLNMANLKLFKNSLIHFYEHLFSEIPSYNKYFGEKNMWSPERKTKC